MNSRPQGYEERIYFYNSMIIRVLKNEKVTFWSKKDQNWTPNWTPNYRLKMSEIEGHF
jgi:hypothetical protein